MFSYRLTLPCGISKYTEVLRTTSWKLSDWGYVPCRGDIGPLWNIVYCIWEREKIFENTYAMIWRHLFICVDECGWSFTWRFSWESKKESKTLLETKLKKAFQNLFSPLSPLEECLDSPFLQP